MTEITTTRVDHTAKAFDTDLQDITRKVAEMGGLAERQIADSVQALVDRDVELGERVIAMDPAIDALQREVEEKAILTIARRQPMAIDLRECVSAMRVCNDLERIGDHAKHIGKRVVALDGDFYPQKLIRGVEHMSALVLAQLKQVLDCLCQPRLGGGARRLERRRRSRCDVHVAVPRAPHLYDGGSAQHHLLHASDVLRQGHRAHRRPCHQHRRNRLLHD